MKKSKLWKKFLKKRNKKMFEISEFSAIKDARKHIKKILAELETYQELEFQLIHSLSEVECYEDGGTWDDVSEMLMRFLRELDTQQGFMIHDSEEEEHWDFLEWPEPDELYSLYPKNASELYVYGGEGLIVIHNKFAICEGEYPVVVVKKSFWNKQKGNILEMLKDNKAGFDYTAKISPALYIELFAE
jgi:hypothetical protein